MSRRYLLFVCEMEHTLYIGLHSSQPRLYTFLAILMAWQIV